MSELYRLVYASKNLLSGTEAEKAAAITQILATSQRNNAVDAVTGALMFNDGAFAQVLEGPQRGVEVTFERIQRDMRHGDVTVLQCGPVESRGFANWSMAFVGQSAVGQALWADLAAESGFELARLDGDAVFAMLHTLVLEEEGLASGSSARPAADPVEPRSAGLDVAQVRAEIAHLRSDRVQARADHPSNTTRPRTEVAVPPAAQSARAGRRSSRHESEAALAVFKAALASERQRTNDLRAEIDALHVTLAASEGRQSLLREERDLWVERARVLAATLYKEADEARGDTLGTCKPMVSVRSVA